jgi:hypothetical protein
MRTLSAHDDYPTGFVPVADSLVRMGLRRLVDGMCSFESNVLVLRFVRCHHAAPSSRHGAWSSNS